ncbi:MAG: mechanosensitive ion channel family protein [Elusimicrobiota bacterium]|jgi:small-conductance mechanosensitive channel
MNEELIKRWLFDPHMGRLIAAGVGLLAIYILVRFLRKTAARYVKDFDSRYRAKKALSFVGYLAALLLLAVIFSDRLSKLTVAFGVAGAGIAFALQEVIASVAGWAAISLGGYFRVGDRVQMGGIKGDVIDVGVLRTTIMEMGQWVQGDLYNGRIVKVSNSFLFKEPVFNYSADFPFLWDEIVFPVRYDSDWRYANKMLEDVAAEVCGDFAEKSKDAWKVVVAKYRIEAARIDPLVSLRADQNWIEFTVRYIVDYSRRRATKDALFKRILEEVDKSGGRIRIATSSLEVSSDGPLDVRLEGPRPPR